MRIAVVPKGWQAVELSGIVRLDMTGLDPLACPPVRRLTDLAVDVSAWNAPVRRLKAAP
ncbi:MAG: hypothetical protein M1608_16820 [Candidatus Omnitrophica bacterium]|nr:hypothetical protein [Candidatus Omnitrophota bacterium]